MNTCNTHDIWVAVSNNMLINTIPNNWVQLDEEQKLQFIEDNVCELFQDFKNIYVLNNMSNIVLAVCNKLGIGL